MKHSHRHREETAGDQAKGKELPLVDVARELEVEVTEACREYLWPVLENEYETVGGQPGEQLRLAPAVGKRPGSPPAIVHPGDDQGLAANRPRLVPQHDEARLLQKTLGMVEAGVKFVVAEDGVLAKAGPDSGQLPGKPRQVVHLSIHQIAGGDQDIGPGLAHPGENRRKPLLPHQESQMDVGNLHDTQSITTGRQLGGDELHPFEANVAGLEPAVTAGSKANQKREQKEKPRGEGGRDGPPAGGCTEQVRHQPVAVEQQADNDKVKQQPHPAVAHLGREPRQPFVPGPLDKPRQYRCRHHQDEPRGQQQGRHPAQSKAFSRLDQQVQMAAAVNTQKSQQKEGHAEIPVPCGLHQKVITVALPGHCRYNRLTLTEGGCAPVVPRLPLPPNTLQLPLTYEGELSVAFLTIDHDKCKRDGICVAECPFSLILENKETGFPEIRPAAERLCITCGHCLAVCPHQALSLAAMVDDHCPPLDKKLLASPAALAQFLKSRRSIRTYRQERITRATLEQLLDIARWAPSAKNGQPVHWLMVEDATELRRLAGMVVSWFQEKNILPGVVKAWSEGKDMVLRNAPHLAIAHAPGEGLSKPTEDCTIALTYLELAAHAHGIGACWAGFLMSAANAYQPLTEALALPAGHKVYGALMLGYPKFRYRRIPPRQPLKIEWR